MPRPPGPPRRPIEETRRLGNPGRNRPLPKAGTLIPLAGAAEPPEPERVLGEAGRALWHRVWRYAPFLARDIDCEMVLHLCELIDERQGLRVVVIRDGDWRQRAQLRKLDAVILTTLSELGFSPTARARLNVAEVVPQSRLAEFLA